MAIVKWYLLTSICAAILALLVYDLGALSPINIFPAVLMCVFAVISIVVSAEALEQKEVDELVSIEPMLAALEKEATELRLKIEPEISVYLAVASMLKAADENYEAAGSHRPDLCDILGREVERQEEEIIRLRSYLLEHETRYRKFATTASYLSGRLLRLRENAHGARSRNISYRSYSRAQSNQDWAKTFPCLTSAQTEVPAMLCLSDRVSARQHARRAMLDYVNSYNSSNSF